MDRGSWDFERVEVEMRRSVAGKLGWLTFGRS
jgi:hypothetical protein